MNHPAFGGALHPASSLTLGVTLRSFFENRIFRRCK